MPAHSEAFIQDLVDEALHRTPSGGFPELERRHGLAPGTLFDWVDRYGPPPAPRPFDARHVWIGTTELDETTFLEYFDNDPSYWELEDDEIETATADVTGCGFSIDLRERYLYDEDLLQVMWRPHPVSIRELVDETTLRSEDCAAAIVRACADRGILTANAGFAYADPSQGVPDPARTYNGLVYLGLFED